MKNKTLVYSAFIGFLMVLSFGLFVNETKAQYYTNSYNPYLYTQNYNNNITSPKFPTYPLYPLNQNNSLSYPNYFPEIPYSYNTGNNYYPTYNQSQINLIPGCLPGYNFSVLTGERCDSIYDYDDNILNGDDGTIEDFDVRDGDDTDLEEGDNNAEIVEIRFDVEDGDIRLDKIKFNFEFTGYGSREDLPWNTFDEIRLLSDGEEIASTNCDDNDEWDEQDDNLYSITFSDLDEIIREDERAKLTLEVDINSSISGSYYNDISWDIFVSDRGLRALNGDEDKIYEGDDEDTVSINISEN